MLTVARFPTESSGPQISVIINVWQGNFEARIYLTLKLPVTSRTCGQSNMMQLEASWMEQSAKQEGFLEAWLKSKGTLHLKMNQVCSHTCGRALSAAEKLP